MDRGTSGSVGEAQRWSADLTVPRSITGGGNLFNRKRVSIALGLLLSHSRYPDITEIWLKRDVKAQGIPAIYQVFFKANTFYIDVSEWVKSYTC